MLLLPQSIKDYTSINIVTRYPNWNIGTSYAFEEIIFYEHYYYKSIIDDNIGKTPLDNQDAWLRWAVSNRFAQIDLQAQTATRCDVNSKIGGLAPYTLISEFQNNNYDTIALGGVHSSAITIEILDSTGAVVWTKQESSDHRTNVYNWWDYYFIPLPDGTGGDKQDFFFRMPTYDNSHKIRVTLGDKSGYSECAYMIAGRATHIGCTLYNLNIGLEDFSVKEVDDFGITTLLRRKSRQTMDIDVLFDSPLINNVTRAVKAILGTTTLFINDEASDSKYENLLLLGYVESYTVILANPEKTTASLSLMEVI